MTLIKLRGPLKSFAGEQGEHEVAGETVGAILRALETEHASLRGWILDERGLVRPHINVFVNGENGSEETPVGPDDRVDVLPAISGGCT